jgi:hypothetical protein
MNHFKGTNETERYNNDLLNETRRMNTLLEQLVQLFQPKIEKAPVKTIAPKKTMQKKTTQRRKIS